MTYIILYKSFNGEIKVTRLEADNYSAARKNAQEVIEILNSTYSFDAKCELISVQTLKSLESWNH